MDLLHRRANRKRKGYLSEAEFFSSTIIATVGRPTLSRAVESILSQKITGQKLEVVVVNDSGKPLLDEPWQKSEQVVILSTQQRERCVARNAGAAIARGRYLHFLDDDDFMLPGAFEAFLQLSEENEGAGLLFGTTLLTDENGNLAYERTIETTGDAFIAMMAGPWLPLQASLIKAEVFFETIGFDWRLVGLEQKDLTRRIARIATFAGTKTAVACVIQDRKNSTSDHTLSKSYSVWSRDNIVDEQGTFRRLLQSAATPYWRGKMVRSYATCALFQVKRHRVARTLYRMLSTIGAMVLVLPSMAHPKFWTGLIKEG